MHTHDSPALLRRFWSKVAIAGPDACWEWTASRRKRGYGQFGFGGKLKNGGRIIEAHRMAWMLTFGDPGSLHVLHTCDNPPCCNPAHLYLGTHQQNIRDAVDRKRYAHGDAHWARREPLRAAAAFQKSHQIDSRSP